MPSTWIQYIPVVALAISLLALLVSFANLGWNIYRELALRARLRVNFGVNQVFGGGLSEPITRVFLSAVNLGPGPIRVRSIIWKKGTWWNPFRKHVGRGVIIHDYTEPLSAKLPTKLDVGESMNLVLKYGPAFKLEEGITHIGLVDSFGRDHWAPAHDVKVFKESHAKDFPAKAD